MKKLLLLLAASVMLYTFIGCERDDDDDDDDDDVRVTSSIMPSTFMGRSVVNLGKMNVARKTVELGVWDHGTIDGDIISLYVNGKLVLDQYTLKGPSEIKKVSVTLDNLGYNYILMYAHNEGSIPPNTCALSINDGATNKQYTMESNLTTNGAFDVVVD